MHRMGKVLANSGCANEIEFWQQYSGLGATQGTWVDHMVAALGKNGYTGTPGDMYRAWLTRMGGMIEAPLYGLTFYKDFTKIPNGTYAGASLSGLLNADLSVGDGTATFTSTSGNFTINGGYSATTANDDVLKYLIANNRTAEQETIIIKFTPTGDFANDGINRYLTRTDTKARSIYKVTTSDKIKSLPNASDFATVGADTTTVALANTTYVIATTFSTESVNVRSYINGTPEGVSSTNTWNGTIGWGTSFYIGVSSLGDNQLNGYIKSVAFFNRKLSAGEVSVITSLI